MLCYKTVVRNKNNMCCILINSKQEPCLYVWSRIIGWKNGRIICIIRPVFRICPRDTLFRPRLIIKICCRGRSVKRIWLEIRTIRLSIFICGNFWKKFMEVGLRSDTDGSNLETILTKNSWVISEAKLQIWNSYTQVALYKAPRN